MQHVYIINIYNNIFNTIQPMNLNNANKNHAPPVYIWISELGQPYRFGLYRLFTITKAAEEYGIFVFNSCYSLTEMPSVARETSLNRPALGIKDFLRWTGEPEVNASFSLGCPAKHDSWGTNRRRLYLIFLIICGIHAHDPILLELVDHKKFIYLLIYNFGFN